MKIIKKDGRIQEFDKDKIYNSLRGASRDLDRSTLNESDLKMLVNHILEKIKKIRKNETPTSSFEIIGIVSQVLCEDGFSNLLYSYIKG